MFRDVVFAEEYRTGENDPLRGFFLPAIRRAREYWLAAGYFSSKLFDLLGIDLADFVTRNGSLRLVTSVHLSAEDRNAIEKGLRDRETVLQEHLAEVIRREFSAPLGPGVQTMASLLKVGRLEIKLATRANGSLYHEKLGVLFDESGDYVAFSGSANATEAALQWNFESIDVYTRPRDPSRAERKRAYLERLWEGQVPDVVLYPLPANLARIIVTEHDKTELARRAATAPGARGEDGRYAYQRRAVEWFVDPSGANGAGILWMATGTGKTLTALQVAARLFQDNRIDAIVINASERLLNQWDREMSRPFPGTGERAAAWRQITRWHVSGKKQASEYRQLAIRGKCLLITYSFLPDFVDDAEKHGVDLSRTLLIVDEVHNIGAGSNIASMTASDAAAAADATVAPAAPRSQTTLYSRFRHRLGLSATPFSDYDDERNQFIIDALASRPLDMTTIPNWTTYDFVQKRSALWRALIERRDVFYYGLEDAIRDRVLVSFDYVPLAYEPTSEEKAERVNLLRYWQAKVKAGEASPAAPYIYMAKVFKASRAKIPVFDAHVRSLNAAEKERLLGRAIIFVETMAFGRKVAELLHQYGVRYHTFFTGDEEHNLVDFGKGRLSVLITCHMISEGIDIRAVSSIILFASDRTRLETIQRIGRALRSNPAEPDKTAVVLDFIYEPKGDGDDDPDEDEAADVERRDWLQGLSRARPSEGGDSQ